MRAYTGHTKSKRPRGVEGNRPSLPSPGLRAVVNTDERLISRTRSGGEVGLRSFYLSEVAAITGVPGGVEGQGGKKHTESQVLCFFFPEKLGSCFFFSPTCGPAFGRSAHVRKPRAAHQPPRLRPAPPCPPPSPPRRTSPAHPGGPDRRFTGIDLGSSSKIHSFCGS